MHTAFVYTEYTKRVYTYFSFGHGGVVCTCKSSSTPSRIEHFVTQMCNTWQAAAFSTSVTVYACTRLRLPSAFLLCAHLSVVSDEVERCAWRMYIICCTLVQVYRMHRVTIRKERLNVHIFVPNIIQFTPFCWFIFCV